MTRPDRRSTSLVEVLGRPWVYWSIGVLLVVTTRALTQGAEWLVALAIGAAGAVTGAVLRSVRSGVGLGRLRSSRVVRSVLAHFRGDRDDGSNTRHGPGEDRD